MRLRQIEIFYHVYKSGSISGAARDLHVSQPSVSKVLRHLEDQIDFDLFRREKGRLVATDAAHELFADIDRIYDQIRSLRRATSNIRNRRGGHVRLGVLPSLSLSVGPELIARMREKDPLLSFELTTLHTPQLAKALLEKQSDICIGFGELDAPRIETHKIGEAGLVLVSGEAVPADTLETGVNLIDGKDFVGMRESGPLGALITAALDAQEITPNEIVTAHTYHVALSLARKRVGYTITDHFTAFSHLGGGLHRYRLTDMPKISIFASALSDHPQPELVSAAFETVREVLGEFDAVIPNLETPRV